MEKNRNMLKIGIDTSCLNAKSKDSILNRLDELEEERKIILITSTVNEREQEATNINEYWKNKYLERINEKSKILETGKWNISYWDQCTYGDEQVHNQLRNIFQKENPTENDYYDMWLIETAISGNCDYFLTMNSSDFIDNGKREELEELGIKVRIPDQNFLKEIESQKTI